MRYVFYTATTLNGYLADEDNSLAWLFAVDSVEPDVSDVLDPVSLLVMGSTTYQWVLDHEDLLAHPEKWSTAFFGTSRVVVFSSRDQPIPAGADVTVLSGSVPEHRAELEAMAGGGDIWVVGGGDLAGQFLDAGMLDLLVIAVAPAAVTGGAPLLPRTIWPDRLELLSAERVGQFAMLRYRVLRDQASASGQDA